ncbi:MAG: outer membrane protein transport protein, partial [Endomicrobiaceae bacterium]
GPFITPGARAAGYGTAFVSIADDLTAIYWNPAGLAYQKEKQVMATIVYLDNNATSDDNSGQKYETTAMVPFMAFSTPFNETTTIAVGAYASGGGGGNLAGLPAGQKIKGEQSFMIYNMSVAKEINNKISVGVGVECIEMKDKLVMKVPYTSLGYSIPGITDIDYNRSACGFQGNIGVIYKPVDKLSTGFLLRSGTYIGLPKEQNSSNPSFVNGYTYPMTMELGASYRVLDPLNVAFAVSYNKYSWASVNYTDTVQFRVGTEYTATDKLSLYLGFFNDPNIYKNSSSYGITNIDMYNMQYFTVGAGYDISKAVNVCLNYVHSFTQDVVSNGVTYEYPLDIFRFDFNYKF